MFCKEEDDSRPTPAEDNDAAGRKIDRKECILLIEDQNKALFFYFQSNNRYIIFPPPLGIESCRACHSFYQLVHIM